MLSRIYHQSKHFEVRRRSHCILLSFEGFTITGLMAIFKVSRITIYNWFNAWEENHLAGLYNHPGRGRKPLFTPEQKSQKNSERLEKKLSLTADQKSKVYAFTLTRIQKSGEIKASENKDKKSKGDAFKAVRDEYDSNVNSVLTAEQKTKWVQIKAEAKARKQENKKEGVKKDTPANETEATRQH